MGLLRESKCRKCKERARPCACQREVQSDRRWARASGQPDPIETPCTQVCRPGKGACGRKMRGGVCPCPYC